LPINGLGLSLLARLLPDSHYAGHMATVHRFISPTSCGSSDTTCVCSSWGWRHLVHRELPYGTMS
jgi:hypothetical protein